MTIKTFSVPATKPTEIHMRAVAANLRLVHLNPEVRFTRRPVRSETPIQMVRVQACA